MSVVLFWAPTRNMSRRTSPWRHELYSMRSTCIPELMTWSFQGEWISSSANSCLTRCNNARVIVFSFNKQFNGGSRRLVRPEKSDRAPNVCTITRGSSNLGYPGCQKDAHCGSDKFDERMPYGATIRSRQGVLQEIVIRWLCLQHSLRNHRLSVLQGIHEPALNYPV